MAGILSDFIKKTQQKYKKTNDQIVFDSGTIHDVCSSGSLVIDTQFNGGLAIYGRLVELLSFECLTGSMTVNIRINENLPNTSKVVNAEQNIEVDKPQITIISVTTITMLDLMKLVESSEHQIEIETPDGFQPIGDFFVKGQKKTLELKFTDGTVLQCSKDHLIQVPSPITGYDNPQGELDGHHYSRAKWLNQNDKIISKDGEKTLESIEYIDYHNVYDIEVKHPNHRYYANDVSHHNSGGKTTLAMQSMREAKKRGIVLLFDNEQAFDYTYANSMGLFEDENFVVFRPRNAEETEAIAEDAIATLGSTISMMVFDSVAATRPKSELERKHGESSQKAEHATFWGNFGNKLVVWASKHHIAVVLINQLRSKPSIGNMDKFSIGNTGVGAGYSNTDNNYQSCVTYDTTVKVKINGEEMILTMEELKKEIGWSITL